MRRRSTRNPTCSIFVEGFAARHRIPFGHSPYGGGIGRVVLEDTGMYRARLVLIGLRMAHRCSSYVSQDAPYSKHGTETLFSAVH
jgi:hypothetical protein